jgi:hypothetical protein
MPSVDSEQQPNTLRIKTSINTLAGDPGAVGALTDRRWWHGGHGGAEIIMMPD